MLIWVIALHCEAKPIIDFYRLKKVPTHQGFDLYQNGPMQCVICGIGKINAAAATAWIAALNQDQPSIAWINLGTAGAAEHAIGEAFWISKISQPNADRQGFPVPTFSSGFSASATISLDEPSDSYDSTQLFDMEASAFFATATRFSSAELVHCLKIVSDNRLYKTGQNKAAISDLISPKISAINEFAIKLQALNEQVGKLEVDPEIWHKLLKQAHFSQTQQARLKPALRFLQASPLDSQQFANAVSSLSSSRDILKRLDQLCIEQSRNL